MTNPTLFIVGCPRSGTTLLLRMLDAHPRIAIIDETEWFVSWFEKRSGVTPEGFVLPELVTRLLQKETSAIFRGADLQIRPEELYGVVGSGREIQFADFVARLFNRYGEVRGKPLVGTKNPDYVRKLATLHSLWPRARFVHIIRDGRDVSLSLMKWRKIKGKERTKTVGRFATWAEDPVTTAALLWEWHVRLGREAGSALGPGLYYEIRYEALVDRPEAECQALCEFLDVPYDDAMLRFNEGRERDDADLDAKHAWRPVTTGLRDWRTQMPVEDVARFEAVAGGLLDELGYPRADQEPAAEALEHAARLRARFGGLPLPEKW
ncbi:MAG: sulfotransferase [Geobacteraceae bacterium]|nr:sulfotransferase [Geobacteraceae bacterium]